MAIGVSATLIAFVYLPGCGQEVSSLWFCGESPSVVIATLDFIAKLIAAIAWPIVVLLLGLLFQGKINSLLGSMRRLKAPGIEAEFNEFVENAESSLAEQPEIQRATISEVAPHILRYLQEDNKRYAVLEAWSDIERKILSLAEKHGIVEPSSRQPLVFRDNILRRLEFPDGIMGAIRELRSARNAVAHAALRDMSETSVLKYLEIATEIDRYLDSRLG
jgi:hypothetical protein